MILVAICNIDKENSIFSYSIHIPLITTQEANETKPIFLQLFLEQGKGRTCSVERRTIWGGGDILLDLGLPARLDFDRR